MDSNARSIVLAIILLFCLTLFGFVWNSKHAMVEVAQTDRPTRISHKVLDFNKTYIIKKCYVINPDLFDLTLEDGSVIRMHLTVSAPKRCEDEVIRLFHLVDKGTSPRVQLYEKNDIVWIGDIWFTIDGRETNLSKWLKDKGLTYR